MLLRAKRILNRLFWIEISRYPLPHLSRRIKLIHTHQIDTIIDIGANIGQYASEMRNIGFTGQIFSFEPLKEAFQKLQKYSSKDTLWKVFNYSIGERDGKAIINVAKNSVSSSLLQNVPELIESEPDARFIGREEIQMHKLDSIFEWLNLENRNIYLKVDAQGYEEMILLGAQKSLGCIKAIQIEMSLVPSYDGSVTFDEMKHYLNKLGFYLAAIESGFYDKKTGKQLEIDGIFYR